ncbi:MAG: ABC transporter ATP-binding protein [Erysipelotrichaceae bacterium]|nr:ABC transporter ATP-binding protein [Erysipelotrichaceae bacterium]
MAILTVKNLTLGYDSHVIADKLNFMLESGDYLCVVGENGSGKTTLMKTLLGLQEAISGDIIFGDGMQKNEIGYLPQQTQVQKDFPASVEEIVLSGFQGKCKGPFYSREMKEEAKRNMRRMGVDDLARRCYRDLSGGQQQRVLLARALCAAGRMLLLDEPVAGLDPKATENMYELIKSLNDEGVTIIMVTHDVNSAAKYANKILRIGDHIYYGQRHKTGGAA